MLNATRSHWCLITICCLLLVFAGCRNRAVCGPGCYSISPYANSPVAGATTIASPATYSLNIPGNPNSVANSNFSATTGTFPQRQAANTAFPTNGVNVQNGWRPVGSVPTTNSTIQSGAGSSNSTPTSGNTSSVLENRETQNGSQIVDVAPRNQTQLPSVNPSINQPVQNSSTGLSFTDATNFRSTAVDERLDHSRLPVTDASQVRAPTNFSPTTSVGQFNVPYYVPNQQVANIPGYQNGTRIAAIPQYAQPQYVPPNRGYVPVQSNTVVGSFGQPNFAQPSTQIYHGLQTQNPRVLAQSTVYADPSRDPNFQNGWRDRELTAGRDSLNR